MSDVRIVRTGSDWAAAEVVAAGEEAVVRAGDTFVMQDVPWDEYGPQALGEMWTPGDDARVVGFAIRESSRCCAMTHSGMQSPWYGTLTSGIAEMRGEPVTLRLLRWDLPTGAILPEPAGGMSSIRFLDSGKLEAQLPTDGSSTDAEARSPVDFSPGRQLYLPQFADDPAALVFANPGPDAAVVYELRVEPGRS